MQSAIFLFFYFPCVSIPAALSRPVHPCIRDPLGPVSHYPDLSRIFLFSSLFAPPGGDGRQLTTSISQPVPKADCKSQQLGFRLTGRTHLPSGQAGCRQGTRCQPSQQGDMVDGKRKNRPGMQAGCSPSLWLRACPQPSHPVGRNRGHLESVALTRCLGGATAPRAQREGVQEGVACCELRTAHCSHHRDHPEAEAGETQARQAHAGHTHPRTEDRTRSWCVPRAPLLWDRDKQRPASRHPPVPGQIRRAAVCRSRNGSVERALPKEETVCSALVFGQTVRPRTPSLVNGGGQG